MDRDTDMQDKNNKTNNTYRRCHSRQTDQHDNILEFLSSLDKKKTLSLETRVSKINQDWSNMVDDEGREDVTRERDDDDDKHVSWSDDLLDVRIISPRQTKLSRNICTNNRKNCLPRIKKLGILTLINSN